MPHSEAIALSIFLAFVVFITARGSLATYIRLIA